VTGGVESILGAHARLLRRAGHDVLLVAGRGDAELVPEIDSRHPQVEDLARRLAGGEEPLPLLASLRGRLVRLLAPALHDRDLVLAHNVLTMPFNLALACALVDLGKPILAWTHDVAWVNPRYASYRRERWPCSILHEPQPRATYVAISEVRRRELCATMGLPASAVPVVPNGLDAARFLGLGAEVRRLACRAGLQGAWPLVLVPVRITPRKRIELAIEAAATLRAEHPELRLVVSGPLGPHSAENQEYAASLLGLRRRLGLEATVRFLFELAGPTGAHPVGDRAIADLYRMADCVLLPSESEGFGLPVLEAGLARAPIVCADIEVLREVAGGAEAIFTFPAGAGAAEVVAALRRALEAPAAMLRERVARRYSWPVVLARMEDVIATALER
jgi:glycosyltransferase involved in cell wall biosynthesis